MRTRVWFEQDTHKLAAQAPAWQALGDRCLEPNPFYEPWFLLPALRHLPELRRDCGVVFVEKAGDLVAAVPLVRPALFRGLPMYRARLVTHKYSFCHTPLLAADAARHAWGALLDWCRAERTPVLELDHVYADGAFHDLMTEVARERGLPSFVRASSDRAFFRPRASVDAYLAEVMSSKRRREIARRERQLQAAGTLTLPELGPGGAANVAPYIEAFATLEAAGWKGNERTALASSPEDRAFFTEAVTGGHAAGRVWFQNAVLDGNPVASLLSFVAGPSSFSWKICHDEKLAKLSPGVFIELVNLRRLHERRAIEWMDSGATPDHPMLNRLWIDRRRLETRWLATGGRAAGWLVAALPWLKQANARVRSRFARATPTAPAHAAEDPDAP